jgi:hypothetical protein
MTLTDYEREREERIAKNKAILAALDIPKTLNTSASRAPKASTQPKTKKRKRQASVTLRDEVADLAVADGGERPTTGRRTSARLQNIVRTSATLIDI